MPSVPFRVIRRLLRTRSIGMPASALLHAVGLDTISRRVSRLSGFVPTIVRFAVPGLPDAGGVAAMASADSTDEIVRAIWTYGASSFEAPMPELFTRLSRGAARVLDVGANSGFYAILAALASNGQVDAFDPFPPAQRWLKRNIGLNNLCERVHLYPVAVGKESGEARLYVPTKDFGDVLETAASLSPSFRERHSDVLTVRVVALDDHVRDNAITRVDVLKIDVESQEHLVLQGASLLIAQLRPIIFLEVLDRGDSKALDEIRAKHGLVPFCMGHESLVRYGSVCARPEGRNQVLCPPDKIDLLEGAAREIGIAVRH